MSGILLAASLPAQRLLDMEGLDPGYEDTGAATTTYSVQLDFVTSDGLLDILRTIMADSLNDHLFARPTSGLSIRCLYVSGTHLTTGVEDTWQTLTGTRSYGLQYTSTGGVDFVTGTFKFQLSTDGGSTVDSDSGNTTLTAGETS